MVAQLLVTELDLDLNFYMKARLIAEWGLIEFSRSKIGKFKKISLLQATRPARGRDQFLVFSSFTKIIHVGKIHKTHNQLTEFFF